MLVIAPNAMVIWINLVMWILNLWMLQRSRDVLWRWLLRRRVQWLWTHWRPEPGQVRCTRRKGVGWKLNGTSGSGWTMLCLNLSRSFCSTSRIWSRYVHNIPMHLVNRFVLLLNNIHIVRGRHYTFVFRRGTFMKWTICTRLPSQSSLTSSSRWKLISKKLIIKVLF